MNSPLTQSPTTQPGSSENPCLQNNIELSNVFESDDFSSYDIRGKVDAVFLDLPEPWRAISHTTSLFQPSKLGRICCFSPCIEQVQKTYESLIRNGFTAVTMYETLKFDHVSTQLTFPDIQERIDNLRTSKIGSENKKRKVDNITETLESHEPEITSSEIYGPKVCSRSQFWESKGHTSYLTFAEYLPADFA